MTEETGTAGRGWKRLDVMVAVVVVAFAIFLIGREWLARPAAEGDSSAASVPAAGAPSPEQFQAHTQEGLRHYFETKDFPKAEAEFRASIGYAPGEALGYSNLGSALMEQGKWQEAIPILEKAVDLNPGLEIAKNNLAWAVAEKAKAQR